MYCVCYQAYHRCTMGAEAQRLQSHNKLMDGSSLDCEKCGNQVIRSKAIICTACAIRPATGVPWA